MPKATNRVFAALPLFIFYLAGCATPNSANTTNGDAIRACQDLVTGYAIHRDRMDSEAFANLFSKDAVLSVLGQRFEGRAAIKARLEGPPTPPLRHLMSTVHIEMESATQARGISYVTVYAAQTVEPKLPFVVDGFMATGEYHDVFRLTADGWRIAQREFHPIITTSANSPPQ